MYFELLLDAVFGPREVVHEMECGICGNDEVYFRHPHTKETLGRACKTCNFVQKFDKENSETNV